MNPVESVSWLQQISNGMDLLNHHVASEQSPTNVGLVAGVALAGGLLLAFRSVMTVRMILAGMGSLVVGYAGVQAAAWLQSSVPLTAAICAIVGSLLAAVTYRLWLSVGTAAIVGVIVLGFGLGAPVVMGIVKPQPPATSEMPTLLTAEQQQAAAKNAVTGYARTVLERGRTELSSHDYKDFILPGLAALAGLALGWRAPRFFAGVWIGWIGAASAVLGASMLACLFKPELRATINGNPETMLWIAGGVWAVGTLSQTRGILKARRAAKAPPKAEAAPDPA